MYRIQIDRSLCSGFGACAELAPEIFTVDELVRSFSFDRVQHAGARFDWDKLNWINGEYIRGLDDGQLSLRLKPFLPNLDEKTIRRAAPACVCPPRRVSTRRAPLTLWDSPTAPC